MKGQMFILTAMIIAVIVAGIANNYYYSRLPAITKYNEISETHTLINNIQTELGLVSTIGPTNMTRIRNFTRFLMNETNHSNYNINISVS